MQFVIGKCAQCGKQKHWYSQSFQLYECSSCNRKYCDEHCCNSTYVGHLQTVSTAAHAACVVDSGYACIECLAKDLEGKIQGWKHGIIERKCCHPKCSHTLSNIFTSRRSCIVCGRLFCKEHSRLKAGLSGFTKEIKKYPDAEAVCESCLKAHSELRVHAGKASFVARSTVLPLSEGPIGEAEAALQRQLEFANNKIEEGKSWFIDLKLLTFSRAAILLGLAIYVARKDLIPRLVGEDPVPLLDSAISVFGAVAISLWWTCDVLLPSLFRAVGTEYDPTTSPRKLAVERRLNRARLAFAAVVATTVWGLIAGAELLR